MSGYVDTAVRMAAAQHDSTAMSEQSDCVPFSLAMACDASYMVAHGLCKSMGRRFRRGMHFSGQDLIAACSHLNRSAYNVYRRCGRRGGFTVSTAGRRYPTGHYLIRVRRHILAMTDGVVLDWTAGRKHRVIEVWKISKKEDQS